MKRLFIFATMLLGISMTAKGSIDIPPPVTPSPERIVLQPDDLFDKDRSMAICEFLCCPETGTIEVFCCGTGKATENVSLNLPQQSGSYTLILDSEKYYGEGSFTIE